MCAQEQMKISTHETKPSRSDTLVIEIQVDVEVACAGEGGCVCVLCEHFVLKKMRRYCRTVYTVQLSIITKETKVWKKRLKEF